MRFLAAQTIEEAVEALVSAEGLTRVLAGGTDVLVQLRSGMVEPEVIVDIKRLPGMRDILAEDGGFRIGAGVSGAQLGEHAGVCAMWPGVAEAFQLIGSTQIQGRATLAGNLCTSSPAGDAVPALFAADAVVRISGPDGARDVPVAQIPTGPGKNTLARGEIVTSILLPARPANSGDAYLRFIPRTEMDIAVASAGVSLTVDSGGTITAARAALGAVAPTVILAVDAAQALVGTTLDAETLTAFGAACEGRCAPIDDKRGTIAFRTRTAGTLARRAATIAYARAGGTA